ncbi:acid phosphatase [Geomonas edaphica]|uniref:acid phosphatase n=1 Tax=Geomonas edaphica TaxID=2570226 RepID=UPI0010A8E409|nr:phosphatase PAP2 family protein [Geomonas edaphica]
MTNFLSKLCCNRYFLVPAIVACLAGCGSDSNQTAGNAVVNPGPGPIPGTLQGYLSTSALPDSIALLPPPPAEGTAALTLDTEISQRSFALKDTPRWAQAISDADLSFPHAAGTFACSVNTAINEADTPHLYMLLRRTLTDIGLSTYAAKKKYQRTRPFVINNQPICTPDEMDQLETDGSYPSGHTAVGWGWALILSEISPDQTNAIISRGLAFGESRNVCNVHWHSDVVQGRVIAAAAVAKLHADPAFLAELEAAKAEIAAAKAKGLTPAVDCTAEAAALAVLPSLAQ